LGSEARKSFALKLGIKGYKAIRDYAELSIGRTVLYGPNGAGKTSVMEVIHAIFTASKESPGLLSMEAVHKDFAISVTVNRDTYTLSRESEGRFVVTTPRAKHYLFDIVEALSLLGDAIREELSPRYVAWVDSCRALLYKPGAGERPELEFDVCTVRLDDLHRLSIDQLSQFAEVLNAVLPGARLAYAAGRYRRDELLWWISLPKQGWIRLSDLAYGYRRSMLVLLALGLADVVLIESYETALHTDLAVDLLRLMSYDEYRDKIIIVETHHGGVLSYAISLRWRAYYMEDGRVVKELSKPEDLKSAELYKREMEAYLAPAM